MNRHITTWATVAIAAFSLTACSGAPTAPVAPTGGVSTAPATSAPATSAPAPEQTTPAAQETTESGQSLAEACIEPSAKLLEAEADLLKVQAEIAKSGGKDPKSTVKAVAAMADVFGKLAESSSNPEVKKALTGIQKGYAKLSDLMNKLLVEKDYAAAADVSKVMAELQESLTAFQTLCAA
jgi:hypothetical protein